MRLLVWFGDHTHVAERVVLSGIGKAFLGEGEPHDLQELLKPISALGVGDIVAIVGAREAAAADAQINAALADVVQRGDLFSHAHRVSQRENQHRRAHP